MLVLPSILFGAFFTLAVAWMLGNVCLHGLPVPRTIALAVGAVVESSIVFALLACGAGGRLSFLLMGAVSAAAYWWIGRGAARLEDPAPAVDRVSFYLTATALACYAALYLINAMAPELEPDARAYHLGLTAEYVRLGGFPHRVAFFEMLPQGFEMLFVPAFAFGKHSAARLVHCAFLLATVPLMWRIGRRLGLPEAATAAAAVLYFCAPVAGITGTSAYTDAGGVFFTLATFYLLLVWRDTRDIRYLAPAGLAAGFCYAIKFPGAIVPVLAVLFVVIVSRGIHPREVAILAGAAALAAGPWVLRAAVITGDPAAPLFNRLFPNAYFHPNMERDLAFALGSLWGVPPKRVPYELIAGGTYGGIMGPVFFALPLGLLALGKRAGRLCWIAGVLLAVPWYWNTGARFLMPALPFLAIVLALGVALALPRPALWLCVAVQAVGCWPQVYAHYHPGYAWRIERIPWRAALRIQPERDYLAGLLPPYNLARMVEAHTRPGDRVFALISVATAYTGREVLEYWHSALADELSDALRVAHETQIPIFDVRADWPPQPLQGIRIRLPQASTLEWLINEVQLFSGSQSIAAGPPWKLSGWPFAWELPLAFDGNMATRWRSGSAIQPGMYAQADFNRPRSLTGAVMATPSAIYPLPFEFYGRQADGWHLLSNRPTVTRRPPEDLRTAATGALKRAGFNYILADRTGQGNGLLGAAMADHPGEWGLEKAAELGPIVLFRIR